MTLAHNSDGFLSVMNTNTLILLLLLYFIFIHMPNYLEQDYYYLIFLELFRILVPFIIKNALNQVFSFVMIF
jgi:hypothetical protein